MQVKMDKKELLNIISSLLQAIWDLKTTAICPPYDNLKDFDFGLRSTLWKDVDYNKLIQDLLSYVDEKNMYCIIDNFHVNYVIFKLPCAEDSFAVIGPYLTQEMNDSVYAEIIEENNFNQQMLRSLKIYHNSLPLIPSQKIISTINAIASLMYGDSSSYGVRFLTESWRPNDVTYFLVPNPELALSMSVLEERYSWEKMLISSVAKGDRRGALKALHHFASIKMPPRNSNPMRDLKNHVIILNILCRKAAEESAVHPVYLDEISEKFAIRLETLSTKQELTDLCLEMIRKYCILVQNHSLKKYSLPIRNAINYINFNLNLPLSLKSVAEELNLNPNYLSTLYKKETGTTITDFINHARVKLAIKLLNTSDMQIQNIACYVGIEDVNYFSKLFKKIIGITPTAYRSQIKGETSFSLNLNK